MRVANISEVPVRKMARKRKSVTEEEQQNNVKQSKQAADNKETNKVYFRGVLMKFGSYLLLP